MYIPVWLSHLWSSEQFLSAHFPLHRLGEPVIYDLQAHWCSGNHYENFTASTGIRTPIAAVKMKHANNYAAGPYTYREKFLSVDRVLRRWLPIRFALSIFLCRPIPPKIYNIFNEPIILDKHFKPCPIFVSLISSDCR